MLHTLALWLGVIGMVCLALESIGVAMCFFGTAVWLLA